MTARQEVLAKFPNAYCSLLTSGVHGVFSGQRPARPSICLGVSISKRQAWDMAAMRSRDF